MPKLLMWIAGYGTLLIASDAVSRLSSFHLVLSDRPMVCGWFGGVIFILAGLAAVQRRRSLRLTGLYITLFTALALTAFFSWDAAAEWRRIRSTGIPVFSGVCLTILAILSVSIVAVISKLRPREGIASRGYSVTLPAIKRAPVSRSPMRQEEPRHSEAG